MGKKLKRAHKKIRYILRSMVMRFLSFLHVYLKFDIVFLASNTINRFHFYRVNVNKIKSILKSENLVFFDIGARGGINPSIEKYMDILDVYLSEADDSESTKLNNEEVLYKVHKGIGRTSQGEVDLHLCKKPELSSFLKPNGRFLDYYTNENPSRFEVINKTKIDITNVSTIFKNRDSLDILKIDVQGYELEVIRGLGEVRPLIIETEISFVPIYQDSATFFDLGKEIYDLGYIMFHSSYASVKSPKLLSSTNKDVNQIPIHGDAWFVPDWTRKKGMDIIKNREKKWEAIMLLYGMKSVFDYAAFEKENT